MGFWEAATTLPGLSLLMLFVALGIALAFEFINGFHDTANAVTTVIYTRSLPATPAVIYSGILNFLGVLFGGTAVAFSIVYLLPHNLLVDIGASSAGIVMVLSLLIAGVIWNLGTWYMALPVSSSHTLIGSILGVGLANSLMTGQGLTGVNWYKAGEVFLALLVSPVVGFVLAALFLLLLKVVLPYKILYLPPEERDEPPPTWVRSIMIVTCGGISYAHGSNDGQKGMGLILLVLISFMPFAYALETQGEGRAQAVYESALAAETAFEKAEHKPDAELAGALKVLTTELEGKAKLSEVPKENRAAVRSAIFRFIDGIALLPAPLKAELTPRLKPLKAAIEFVPLWVMIAVALALGIGTTIGYKRIVYTIAEKIGKTHMTYGQGMAAEVVTAATILAADLARMPVSTTQILASGVAGTMWANGSGLQGTTTKKIALAWLMTLPAAITLSALFYWLGRLFF